MLDHSAMAAQAHDLLKGIRLPCAVTRPFTLLNGMNLP
jgi:hypothetical protein